MVLERDSKPLKTLQKIAKPRCGDLEKNILYLVIGRDPTFLLIIKMGRDFKSKTVVAEYVFSNISRNNVGNVQEGIYSYTGLQIDV